MKWYEISVTTEGVWADAVSDILMEYGAKGVEIADDTDVRKNIMESAADEGMPEIPFFDASLKQVTVKAYFPEVCIATAEWFDELAGTVRLKVTGSVGEIGFAVREVDDADWANEWRKYYKPFHITDKVVIKPSWETYVAQDGEIVVGIDPGMAFGTGTHETTAMCAALIQEYLSQGDRLLDVGCGSGILSVIALLLGASRAVAVDIDKVAVSTAMENADRNGVTGRINVLCGELKNLVIDTADIVVANITADTIIGLSSVIPRYVKNGGIYIVSGIITDRASEVKDSHIANGYELIDETQSKEWVAMIFRCPGSM